MEFLNEHVFHSREWELKEEEAEKIESLTKLDGFSDCSSSFIKTFLWCCY
jgi:hypothetical protein